MKRIILATLALLATSAWAQSTTSSSTAVNGNGAQISATASQSVGNRMATITIGNGSVPTLTATAVQNPAGVTTSSFSAGLSIGGTLGNGFGSTAGNAGSTAGLSGF